MERYLYRATGITLAITYFTFVVTMHALLRLWLGLADDTATRQTIAIGLGVLVVTTPLWWLHWRWMRWQLADATATTRQDFQRYVLTVSIVALFVIFGSAGFGVAVLARLALGLLADSVAGWGQSLGAITAMLAATGIWTVHWCHVTQRHMGLDLVRS